MTSKNLVNGFNGVLKLEIHQQTHNQERFLHQVEGQDQLPLGGVLWFKKSQTVPNDAMLFVTGVKVR